MPAAAGKSVVAADASVSRSGKVAVVVDFQTRLLVRFDPAGGRSIWLWPQKQQAPMRWLNLRAAAFSTPRSQKIVSASGNGKAGLQGTPP